MVGVCLHNSPLGSQVEMSVKANPHISAHPRSGLQTIKDCVIQNVVVGIGHTYYYVLCILPYLYYDVIFFLHRCLHTGEVNQSNRRLSLNLASRIQQCDQVKLYLSTIPTFYSHFNSHFLNK